MREPAFHKPEKKEKVLSQLGGITKDMARIKLLRNLTIIWTSLTVVELFKADFGQLYMLRYVSAPQLLGILWAIYAFTWSLGSLIAHRLHARLNMLVFISVLPLVAMAFIDARISLVLFMIQAVAAAALFNQIETRVQDATPSHVRASILSVISSLGRLVSIPASLLIGWLIHQYNAFVALQVIAILAVVTLIYWLFATRTLPQANVPIVSK